jgi:signal transduction histidine kinase
VSRKILVSARSLADRSTSATPTGVMSTGVTSAAVTPSTDPRGSRPARTPTGSRPSTPRRRATDTDLLMQYHRPLAYLRWAVLIFDVAIGSVYTDPRRQLGALAPLVIWNAFRSLQPLRVNRKNVVTAIWLVIDLSVPISVVASSGGWASSFLLSLIPPLVVAGLTQGRLISTGLGLLTGIFITSTMSLQHQLTPSLIENGVRWTGVLMIVSLATGLAYRMVRDASSRQLQETEHMVRLSEANALLYDLQRVARRLPSSLDLAEVLRSTTQKFSDLTSRANSAVLFLEPETDRWTVAEAFGASMPLVIESSALPAAARASIAARTIVIEERSSPLMSSAPTTSAIYAPLVARDQLIGLLVAEDRIPSELAETGPTNHKILAEGFAQQAAVTLDNARWFGRIRSAAADDERVRIARDLHDRVGQSLALIGFEIDRIARTPGAHHVSEDLTVLRGQVRSAVSEVRETLYDLRTDVRDDGVMTATLNDFLGRVSERSNLSVHLDTLEPVALPVRLSRELWHIAQEAIINVERHASATQLWVTWHCDGNAALLSVRDDGRGFGPSDGRTDSYGLRGLRERAAAIGAFIDIQSAAGEGTTLTVRLQDA